jgi:hypothetical protein
LVSEAESVETGAAAKRGLVDRIVATPAFNKSERLVSFLLHVCRMEAEGRSDEISEQQIGEAVFGRSQNYDPSIDGIVRSHASRLRIRLDQYFETEGIDEPVRLSIPRGGYVPIYEPRVAEPVLSSIAVERRLEPAPAIPLDREEARRPRWLMFGALALTLAIAFLAGAVFHTTRISGQFGFGSPSDALWRSLFVPGRPTFLVVGDAGVNMFENIARRQVTAEEYSSGSWLNDPIAQTPAGYTWVAIPRRSYTPWFVVNFATRLARIAQVKDESLRVISARELTLGNLKNDQLILTGGPEYNPWEQLLGQDQNFHVFYDGQENSISIFNKRPEPGELPLYKWRQSDPVSHLGYSLISFSKNLNGNGHILALEGSTAQGDEAAAEFLLDNAKFDPILKKAMARDGRLLEFEMVLQTNFVAGGNFDSRVIAFRVHP